MQKTGTHLVVVNSLKQGREEDRKEVVERMQELLDSGFSVEEAMNIILEEIDSSRSIDS